MRDDFPTGWAGAPIGEIAEINPRHPRALDDSTPVSFAPMAALNETKPEFQFLDERPLGEVRKGFTHFAEGDVLFAKITPCMENGKGAIATSLRNGLGCGTTELHVLRLLGGIDPNYVYRFLAQPSVRREAKENFTGTAGQARVPKSFIEHLELPLAPLAEQRRIVAKLEKLLDKVDTCQERLARVPALLKRFRQSVLGAACSGRLTADWREGHPQDGWPNVTVEEIASEIRYGYTARASQDRSGTKFLRITDIQDGKVNWETVPYCDVPASRLARYSLNVGDIVFARTGATTGKSFLIEEHPTAVFASYLIRVRADERVSPEFLYLFFQTADYWRQISENISGSAQPNCNATKLANLTLTLPSVEEQQEIVRRTEALFAVTDQLEARYAKAKAHVDRLTPSLLSKAFRGELVRTEAELTATEGRDCEPAKVLMERIRQQRVQDGGSARKKICCTKLDQKHGI